MTCGVYAITNVKNGKRYVGVSRDVNRRWNAHRAELRRGVHYSDALQEAWNADGEEFFSFDVLEVCDPAEFSRKEAEHINKFLAKNPQHGYNRQSGPKGPRKRPFLRNPYWSGLRD